MLTINEANIVGAWNVQGDAQRIPLALPTMPNTVHRDGDVSMLWLGPRSWLILAAHVDAGGAAVFDVSASRVAWTLRGEQAAVALNKHCPLDLPQMPRGTCAQSLFGQVNALVYRHAQDDAFTTFVARSFAHDVLHHLEQGGCETIAARPFVAD